MAGVTIEKRFLKEERLLEDLKGKISRIYAHMGGFIVRSTEQMHDFRKMITPYVNYFFTPDYDASANCFLGDVVAPSKNELNAAIDKAVAIMAGDEKMNDVVARAIEEVLGLKRSVDAILSLIDEIDIYAENMLIISTKYGEEGMALARISSEMGALAGQVNGIGMKFRDFLEQLDVSRADFNAVRGRIDVISENYLTRMKLNLTLDFDEMTTQLNSISKMVHGMFSGADDIEDSMKSMLNNIQMEDIIRQKIEKILFYLENEAACGDCHSTGEDYGPVMLHVVSERLADLMRDVSNQYDLVNGWCARLNELLNAVRSRLETGDELNDERLNRMDLIYHRIEDMKNEYINYMEEIIANKESLLMLSSSIVEVLEGFDALFSGILSVVQRFEALNMVARIELARHARLSRTLGGALSSVITLPEKLKRIVAQSADLYRGIMENMIGSVTRYSENFKLQEEVLEECIGSMKRVSVKLYESRKYYWDISLENSRFCRKVLEFNDENRRNIGLFEAKETIRDIMAGINAYAESEYGDYAIDIALVQRQLQQRAGRTGEDPVMAALSREFDIEKTKDHVIIF